MADGAEHDSMKTIQSAGGPLIALLQDRVRTWSGVSGKSFVGERSPLQSDYEATAGLTKTTGELRGVSDNALLIAMPLETAIIVSETDLICIAQVECAEPDWSFVDITELDFEKAEFLTKDDTEFNARAGRYMLFDAAYAADWVKNDYLTFDMSEGPYTLSFALYDPDPTVSLLLYRFRKEKSSKP